MRPANPQRSSPPALAVAALAIPTFALMGLFGLPFLALLLSLSLSSLRLPWDAINWAIGAAVPFLATCRRTELQGCQLVVQNPFLLTLVQWAALAGINMWLVRSGTTRWPWLSGFALTVVFGLLSVVVVQALGLEFDRWRT